jgi:hypothetical protein
MQIAQWKKLGILLSVILFIGVVGGILLSTVPVGIWRLLPAAQVPSSSKISPPPNVPELGYCEVVDAEEWISATQTRPIQLERCVSPDDEWVRAHPGKRISPADVVPIDTPPVTLPAASVEAPNPTQ